MRVRRVSIASKSNVVCCFAGADNWTFAEAPALTLGGTSCTLDTTTAEGFIHHTEVGTEVRQLAYCVWTSQLLTLIRVDANCSVHDDSEATCHPRNLQLITDSGSWQHRNIVQHTRPVDAAE